jgi:SAM-dependent methyltransferase
MPLYDAIGSTYDTTRKADPDVTRCLARHLNFTPGARYLDIGCGTGNYTVALQQLGAQMHGLEITSTMIAKARLKSDRVRWIQGNAESLPFPDRCFDGAIGTFTIHHMKNPWRAIEEVYRVIGRGHFVIFTADHSHFRGYWLNEYFPIGMAAAFKQMPPASEVARHLERAGFTAIEFEPWEIPEDIQDWFLYAGKHRPEIYLDPAVRAGISTFAQGLITPEETATGCARLEADIKSGRFEEVAARYRHDRGDCLFVVATKA